MDYTHYYFLNDSLICVKLERDSSTHNEKHALQKGVYYFENGMLINQTGQPDKIAKPNNLVLDGRRYITEFKRDHSLNHL